MIKSARSNQWHFTIAQTLTYSIQLSYQLPGEHASDATHVAILSHNGLLSCNIASSSCSFKKNCSQQWLLNQLVTLRLQVQYSVTTVPLQLNMPYKYAMCMYLSAQSPN